MSSSSASTSVVPLVARSVMAPKEAPAPWLDVGNAAEKAFVDTYGMTLCDDPTKASIYYTMPKSVHAEVRAATAEVHKMFYEATRAVLMDSELWPSFGFPAPFWRKALASFFTNDRTISGRVDWTFGAGAPLSLRTFEYNADSASCLMECGLVQDAWCKATGVTEGVDAGLGTSERLTAVWASLQLPPCTVVHFMHDSDKEEGYHSLYMQAAAARAGIVCKDITGVEGLSFGVDAATGEACVVDADGVPVRRIWKTWAYDTLLTQWTSSGTEELRTKGELRLVDAILADNVTVYEPLWTAITANKAILPILCKLYPQHKNLLETSWKPTEEMIREGYVSKPINGRTGRGITFFEGTGRGRGGSASAAASSSSSSSNSASSVSASSTGGGRDIRKDDIFVYQALCTVPKIGESYVQVNAFCIGGAYGGTVLRVSSKPVVDLDSPILALRIVEDGTSATFDDGKPAIQVPSPHSKQPIPPASAKKAHLVPRHLPEDDADSRAGSLAPFGALIGRAPGGVEVYSSHYESASKAEYPTRSHYRHASTEGVFYGFKWQCVEFARRWLTAVKKVTFPDVGMAYEIFDMPYAVRLADDAHLPFKAIENGSTVIADRPKLGCVIIWNEGGMFAWTGHVGIITEATDTYVRVAEQNVEDAYWPKGHDYGRELRVKIDAATGAYTILEEAADSSVKGWMFIPGADA